MTPEEFVKGFYTLKQELLKIYFADNSETKVGQLIKSLKLTDQQTEIMKDILDNSLSDVLYTTLLGLDGCASIGGIQKEYEVRDENGNRLSEEIERYAFEYFQE